MNDELGLLLSAPGGHLKAALVISLLSICVLVGVFYYLNFYTKRRYFTTWTAAWLFYAVWITLCLTLEHFPEHPLLVALKHACVGVAAVFLLWGSARFLRQKASAHIYGGLIVFLLAWSYVGAQHLDTARQAQIPIFVLIGTASLVAAGCFYQFRRRVPYLGAGLLALGFTLWGGYMMAYPFLQETADLKIAALFISAAVQLLIALSMIILVMEEVKQSNETALAQVKAQRTEIVGLENRVHSTEERYRSLFDQASEGIIIVLAENLRILELNQTARRLLGVTAAEARQQSFAVFCRPNSLDPLVGRNTEWLAALCNCRNVSLECKDGGSTDTQIDGAPVEFDGQAAYQFFLREHTAQSRLEQQLRQAEKLSALGKMISGVAHELNNPLAVIKGYLELVLARHELPPQTRIDLEKVSLEGTRAAKLVSNFLSFAREQPAHRQPLDLNELVNRVVELRRYDARATHIEVQAVLDRSLPLVMADTDQIQQVLVNLMSNSIQALADQPLPHRITFRTQREGDLVRISVADNGAGVPEQVVPHIFEPFFTTKEVGTGTGLGLSIAHSIMTDHRGRISYQKAEGGGACFVLELPVMPFALPTAERVITTTPASSVQAPAATPRQPATAAKEKAGSAGTVAPHILILDDEKSISELLGEMLQLLGYRTTLCHNAHDALALVRKHDFDLALSDYRMPMMNGQEFYREVERINPVLAQKIIFLTGDLVSEDTMAFLKSISNPYLAKPFQIAKVEEAVVQVLQGVTTVHA